MNKQNLKKLKRSIREWMGMLSIEELILNQDLVRLFASVEQQILRLEEQYV